MERLVSSKYSSLILAALLILAVGITWFVFSLKSSGRIRNILLISIDTCRADHLGCYGYGGKTTPNIDAIAKDGILFENVVSPVPLTLPAHSSMLTGTIPPYHGVHDNLDYQLAQSNLTLAEILKDNGFATGAIVSSFVLDSQFGIDQGFDYYNDQFEDEIKKGHFAERRGEEASRFACNWLSENKDKPFFLFLHYYDPHTVYDPPEPFASKFANDLYAGEIAYADHCIGKVLKKLKKLNLYDSTLLVITGDHGEGLNEHREKEHGFFIYDSTIKVPLIFRCPKSSKGKKVNDVIGLIDIVPTFLASLGIEVPPEVQGKDLSGYFEKNNSSGDDRYLCCESLLPTSYNCNPLLGVVTSGWKYIQSTRPELYNLKDDPREMNNLAEKQLHRARLMQGQLKQILETHIRRNEIDSKLALDEASRRRLESLGYVAAGIIDESLEFDQSKNDPKDYIDFHKKQHIASGYLSAERIEQAKEICERMIAEYPDIAITYSLLGEIAFKENELDKAVTCYFKALHLDPRDYRAQQGLGLVFAKQKRFEESVKHFQKALHLKPNEYKIHNQLGLVYSQQGNFGESVKNFQEALRLNGDFREARYNLGVAYAHMGKLDEAIKHWNKALALEKQEGPDNTDDPAIHVALADALIYQGKVDQAISHWEESLKLEPENAKVHADLAHALTLKGKIDEAIAHLTESLRLEPAQPILLNALAELLYTQGKVDEAIRHWQQALSLRPDMPRVLNNLAWIMATHPDEKFRNSAEAIQLAEQACNLTNFENPESLDTLSAAYAAAERFDEAIQTAERAEEIFLANGLQKKTQHIRSRLELYKTGRPYRE